MDIKKLKRPSILIAIFQLISFVVLYEIIAIVIGFCASLIGQLADLMPVFNPFNTFAKPSEGILNSITPIIIVLSLFYVTSFIFKKYLYSIISVMLHFMLMAYLAIDVIAEQVYTHGFISWETINQVWFTLLLCGGYLFLFIPRSDLLAFVEKMKMK